MRKIKKAGSVLKGETVLVKGLRWRVAKVTNLNKKVLFFDLERTEKNQTYRMGLAQGIDKDFEWVVTK